MNRMMGAYILAGGDLHKFLEGKYLSGYFVNLKEFEEKYYSLELCYFDHQLYSEQIL